jgi:predicted enzyme related to lactoylglutathione lyase
MSPATLLWYTAAMPKIESHPPGDFCWMELATSDQPAAKTFYSSLFGWQAADMPMGPDEYYTMFGLNGAQVGAAYKLKAEMQGVPPNWGLYVAVKNADETAAKVTAAGGKVCAGPFDVMTFGRMAVLTDPTGATFMIWQPMDHKGNTIVGEPGAFCWADLNTKDPAAAAKFYTAVFGWEVAPGKDNSGYLHIKNGDKFIGGMPPVHFQNPNAPPHWMLYWQVENCDAATGKAEELGAKVYMGPQTMEGVGRWSVIADPQGAVSSLFQPLPH